MMGRLIISLLVLGSANVLSHGMSAADQARILNAGYVEYMHLGATHMLSGYDHLLFLFGVVFFLSRFLDVVKFITAFTIGHSITLVFATLLSIKANYYLIDAVIALTVCYKAFENLGGFKQYLQMPSPNLTWMVFGFGLIHGFGLSTRLQQLPLGEHGLVTKILSFNVGVEVGQIIALSVMLLILHGWRKAASFDRFSKVSNVALMIVGGLLLLMQLHGYQHSSHPENYPLNKDDHRHIHEGIQRLSLQERVLQETLLPEASPPATPVPLSNVQGEQLEKSPDKLPDTHSHKGINSHSH
jgi:hypothetical protein